MLPSQSAPTSTTAPFSQSADTIRLAIIDDHPPIREAIRRAASEAIGMTVVADTGSAREALRLVEERGPDVAITDLSRGDGTDVALIEDLQDRCPELQVLVYSMHDEVVYAERALRAGASGYLMKNGPIKGLLKAARRVAGGKVYLSPEMATRVIQRAQRGAGRKVQFPIDELTDRELEVFQMMGQGLSTEAIAGRLGLAQKTIETYRRVCKEKLGYETIGEVLSHAVRWVRPESGRGRR